ncbi:MAG: peptide deformylase [Candidatus Saccharimonadales bacterium]
MSKSEIISVPDPRLRQRSSRVGVITSETLEVIARMEHATLEWEATRSSEVGVALAAVQIGECERIVIVRLNPEDKRSREFEVFINPEITKREGEIISEAEGCLSIPDTYGLVPRHEIVRIRAIGVDGQPVRLKATGFLARVFQHEIDHLHGKLFVDHVAPDNFYRILDDGKLEPLPPEQVDTARLLWHR